MSDIIETIDWAISTIENKLMFGLDEKNAQFARDNRVKAVLRDCRKELKEKDKEIKELKHFAKNSYELLPESRQAHFYKKYKDLISKLESEK